MSFTLHRHLDSATLRKCLPKRFHAQFRRREFADGEFVLIIFGNKSTVLSSQVRKALDELADCDEPNRVAAGYNFTQEGSASLSAQGFRSFSLYDGLWTDAGLKHIREVMSA